MIKLKLIQLLTSFYINCRFDFCRYIIFAMHLIWNNMKRRKYFPWTKWLWHGQTNADLKFVFNTKNHLWFLLRLGHSIRYTLLFKLGQWAVRWEEHREASNLTLPVKNNCACRGQGMTCYKPPGAGARPRSSTIILETYGGYRGARGQASHKRCAIPSKCFSLFCFLGARWTILSRLLTHAAMQVCPFNLNYFTTRWVWLEPSKRRKEAS
jgi:hypothetical protein